MATLTVELPPEFDEEVGVIGTNPAGSTFLHSNITSKTYTISYTPPANISGKLCRLHVMQFILYRSEAAGCIYRLEMSTQQPYGYHVDRDQTDLNGNSTQGRTIAYNVHNSVYTPTDQPILVQLQDGPQNIDFTLTCAISPTSSWLTNNANVMRINDVGTAYKKSISGTQYWVSDSLTPAVALMLHFAPANKKDHYENLDSYSTGPFIRF